jgi:hypothetical protein
LLSFTSKRAYEVPGPKIFHKNKNQTDLPIITVKTPRGTLDQFDFSKLIFLTVSELSHKK